jgi:hypothetical protein
MKRAGRVCTIGLAAVLSAATAMVQNSITNIVTTKAAALGLAIRETLWQGSFRKCAR